VLGTVTSIDHEAGFITGDDGDIYIFRRDSTPGFDVLVPGERVQYGGYETLWEFQAKSIKVVEDDR
jgi:hypothetical protein